MIERNCIQKENQNIIWVDKGSEFYNSYFKRWLKDTDMEMYLTHNEGKSVVAERFIRNLKNKIYKCMTSIPKYAYIDKLNDIVNEYNNTYHRTIKTSLLMLKVIQTMTLLKMSMIKILNVELVIMLEYQNTQIFLLKAILQISPKKFL